MDGTRSLPRRVNEMNRLLTPGIRWMKLTQAAAYSNIGEHRLIELAGAGVISGFRDPDTKRQDWIFDKLSLDAYREGQAAQKKAGSARQKALEILKGIRR